MDTAGDTVEALLDELAHRIAAFTENDDAGVAVAAAVVANLERMAGAEPGGRDDDPALVARRFARIHLVLNQADPTAELAEALRRQLALAADPFTALLTAWNHWQDLRRGEGTLAERIAARCLVDLSRRRIPRSEWEGVG